MTDSDNGPRIELWRFADPTWVHEGTDANEEDSARRAQFLRTYYGRPCRFKLKYFNFEKEVAL